MTSGQSLRSPIARLANLAGDGSRVDRSESPRTPCLTPSTRRCRATINRTSTSQIVSHSSGPVPVAQPARWVVRSARRSLWRNFCRHDGQPASTRSRAGAHNDDPGSEPSHCNAHGESAMASASFLPRSWRYSDATRYRRRSARPRGHSVSSPTRRAAPTGVRDWIAERAALYLAGPAPRPLEFHARHAAPRPARLRLPRDTHVSTTRVETSRWRSRIGAQVSAGRGRRVRPADPDAPDRARRRRFEGVRSTRYICSSRSTSRLRKVGGPSQSDASFAANSLVSGRLELAIASS